MMNYYGGLPTGYGTGSFGLPTGPGGGGSFAEIAERQRAMGPLGQYQAAIAQMNPDAGRYGRQAAMQGFNPAYSMYEAFGVPGTGAETYGSFSDYLASPQGRQGQSQADIQNRMRYIADATTSRGAVAGNIDPMAAGLYETYYGGDPSEEASRRLAATEAMSGFGLQGRVNPQMQRAMQGVIDRMYNTYLGGADYQSANPGGFMDYYLSRRGLRNA